jgi:heat-inducible transcriptional repressor
MLIPLTERQRQILALVVRSYIEDGTPVGSKTLVSRFRLEYSAATVRYEMACLTELGYIMQPHTSGGRIPTELGYRYFVQRLAESIELPASQRQTIRHQFHQARLDLEQWMKLAAAILAHASGGASFVTSPRSRFSRFKHVELIATHGRLVLMVLVMYGGDIKQQMLTLATLLEQPRLSATAQRLNSLMEGRNLEEIAALTPHLNELEGEVTRLIVDTMRRLDTRTVNDIYRDGLANILEDEETRPAVRLLEESSALADMVAELLESDESGVQVVIGSEGRWEELKHCSLILSRYGVGDDLIGEVAVVGSMRMPYGRNISAVRYVSDIMSSLMQTYYAEEL